MRGAVLRKAVAAASQQTIKGTEEGGGKQGGRRSTRRRKVCLLPLKMDSTSESEWYDVQSVSLEIGICGFDDKKRYSSNSAPNPWKRGRKGGGLHECDLLINGPFDSQATVRLRWLPVYATKRATKRGSLWEVLADLSAIRPIPDYIQLHG